MRRSDGAPTGTGATSAMTGGGGAGVSPDFPLAQFWIYARTLRIADGPDEVHLESIAKMELKK